MFQMSSVAVSVGSIRGNASLDTNCTTNCSDDDSDSSVIVRDPLLIGLKAVPMVFIISAALFGNGLVIVSILRFSKLRAILTNYFLVSLAFADFLVALLVMPFNLLAHLTSGVWPFGLTVCDLFNANDVLFSTASLLHLCCISMDRYYAIVTPLSYERRINRRRVAIMLATCWFASILISYVPIFTGIYTTPANLAKMRADPRLCHFVVNPVYAVVSSTVSFWLPCFTMTIVYLRIFVEARRQERKMYKLKKMAVSRLATSSPKNSHNNSHDDAGMNPSGDSLLNPGDNSSGSGSRGGTGLRRDTAVARERKKLRREHKAARTLGIIMGCFIVCWFPFFLWYTITNICGPKLCRYPAILVDILFWIGYFNSTMNPIIYAFFNREFRTAFRRLLRCCPSPPRFLVVTCARLSARRDSLSDEGPGMVTLGSKAPGYRTSRAHRLNSHSYVGYHSQTHNNNNENNSVVSVQAQEFGAVSPHPLLST